MELLSTEQLRIKIQELETFSGEDLKTAMSQLKVALKENPTACLLFLPEDIGQMVAALRRITGVAIQEAGEKKPRAKKDKAPVSAKLTQQELLDAFDEM